MSGGGSQKSKSTTEGWKPAMDLAQSQLVPGVEQYGQDYGQGQGLWTGSQLGAENDLVRQGQDAQMRMGQQYGQQIGNTIQGLEGFINYDPNDPINQARRDALGSQSRATFDQFLRPAVEDRGTSAGQFGGNQSALATGAAMQGLNRDIVSAEADMMNADRNRAMQAIGMAPGLYQQQFVPGAMQEQFGQQRTQRGQLEQMDMIQQFEAERNNRMRSLAEQQGLINPMIGYGQTSTSETKSSSSPMQTAMGLGSMALGGYLGGGGSMGALGGGIMNMFGGGGNAGMNNGLSFAAPFSGGAGL